jgi:vanillate O-demethylase monooxygenase subunit
MDPATTHPLYPSHATFTPNDWAILARYWHPVALVEEVGNDKPFGAMLLDVPLVLYRLGGVLTAALDRCPHRGTRLSLGHLREGKLVCPYHGLEFNQAGQCVRVPSQDDRKRSGTYLDIPTMQVEERYGLIWVCLDPVAAAPIPDWSPIEQPGNQRLVMHDVWNTSAGRHFENFCDLAHFSFAHAGTFGAADHPRVDPYEIQSSEGGFRYFVDVPMLDGNVFGETQVRDIHCEYHVSLPFSTRLVMHFTKGIEQICDAASPMSANRTRIFILKSRDHDQHEPAEAWLSFQHAVNEEDRVMVESQTPRGVPLEIAAERHIASDRLSIAYRRHWSGLGLQGPL